MLAEQLVPEEGNLQDSIERLSLFASTPNGIEKLRGLILQLAVKGKLVQQESSHESASILLEKITAEKERLITEGMINKQKPFPKIPDDDKPSELPNGWVFVRLGSIANRIGSGSTPRGGKSAYTEQGVIFLRSQNVWNDGLRLDDVAYIPTDTHDKMSNTKVYPGDILLNITGASLGRCTVFPENVGEANVSQHVTIIRPTKNETRAYLHCCILSPYVQNLVWSRQVGMAREGLSKKVLELFEIPMPPLEEQKRIVAKVDELMALCDQLEAQQQQQANTVLRANTAAIAALLNSESHSTTSLGEGQASTSIAASVRQLPQYQDQLPNAPEATNSNPGNTATITSKPQGATFEQNWQRIAQHFNTLYGCTLPMPPGEGRQKKHLVGLENLRALRLALLKLGVRGNLTRTHPKDDSVGHYLASINQELDEKKRKKFLLLGPPEGLFELSEGWEWASFWRVAEIQSNLVKPDEFGDMPHIAPNHIEKDTGRLMDYNTVLIDQVTSNKHYFYSGQILYSKIRPNLNKLTVVDFDGLCSADMYPIRAKISKSYLCLYMLSPYFVDQTIADDNRVAMPKINQARLNNIAVPVPPLEEQKRIVAKVDELMDLCDQLEHQLTQAYGDAEKLMDATVKALLV